MSDCNCANKSQVNKKEKKEKKENKVFKKQFKGLYNDSLLVCFVFTRGSTNIF